MNHTPATHKQGFLNLPQAIEKDLRAVIQHMMITF